jgi:hypothetical protein
MVALDGGQLHSLRIALVLAVTPDSEKL